MIQVKSTCRALAKRSGTRNRSSYQMKPKLPRMPHILELRPETVHGSKRKVDSRCKFEETDERVLEEWFPAILSVAVVQALLRWQIWKTSEASIEIHQTRLINTSIRSHENHILHSCTRELSDLILKRCGSTGGLLV